MPDPLTSAGSTPKRNRLQTLPGYRWAQLAGAVVRPGQRGRDAHARLLPRAGQFQPYGTTSLDRYPEAFEVLARELGPAPRILSFGCSSGEEVLSLLRRIPGATVRGLDANPRCVRAARKLVPTSTFGTAVDARGEPAGAYDAVLAMAVFRHGDLGAAPPSSRPLLSFVDVERVLAGLADVLRPGGILVLRHANVRFTDTDVAAGFERVGGPWSADSPVYGPDDRLVPGAVGDDGAFRKLAR